MVPAEHYRKAITLDLIDSLTKSISYPDWFNYIPLTSHPELLHRRLTDDPLIIVHPGFRIYCWPSRPKPEEDVMYNIYMENLQSIIQSSVNAHRTIIVFIPVRFRRETLKFINIDHKQALLVPTIDKTSLIDAHLLGTGEKFYGLLARYITQADICGESADACVDQIETQFNKSGIDMTRLSDCVFPREKIF